MSQPVTLDLAGGWENIVNNVERHNARVRFEISRQKRRRIKRISRIIDYVLCALLAITLDMAGLLASWVAIPGAVLMICIACFFGGRLWEDYRK